MLLSAVDSTLLADSVIVNWLLENEWESKEFTKFCGVVIRRNELLVMSFYSQKRSP